MAEAAHDTIALPRIALRARDLACRRGERLLFSGLDFSLDPGELLLLRGPNGVGKTSLLRVIAGLIRPETGSVSYDGADPELRRETYLHFFGYRPAVKPRLTVEENLVFWTKVFGGRADPQPALDRVGLGPIADLHAGALSSGQTRRLGLALLLAVARPLWLLDEPTAALDAQGDLLVGELLAEHLSRGGSAIAATHLDLVLPASTALKTLTLGAAR